MNVFDPEYGVPRGLNYLFLSIWFYLKCRSYGTLMANIARLFTARQRMLDCRRGALAHMVMRPYSLVQPVLEAVKKARYGRHKIAQGGA